MYELRLSFDILARTEFLDRCKAFDAGSVTEKRTFLGWTEDASVVLGAP